MSGCWCAASLVQDLDWLHVRAVVGSGVFQEWVENRVGPSGGLTTTDQLSHFCRVD